MLRRIDEDGLFRRVNIVLLEPAVNPCEPPEEGPLSSDPIDERRVEPNPRHTRRCQDTLPSLTAFPDDCGGEGIPRLEPVNKHLPLRVHHLSPLRPQCLGDEKA